MRERWYLKVRAWFYLMILWVVWIFFLIINLSYLMTFLSFLLFVLTIKMSLFLSILGNDVLTSYWKYNNKKILAILLKVYMKIHFRYARLPKEAVVMNMHLLAASHMLNVCIPSQSSLPLPPWLTVNNILMWDF